MCHMVMQALASHDHRVTADVRRLCSYPGDRLPSSASELCSKLFTTAYLGTVNRCVRVRVSVRVCICVCMWLRRCIGPLLRKAHATAERPAPLGAPPGHPAPPWYL